jgi:hypothetical protein
MRCSRYAAIAPWDSPPTRPETGLIGQCWQVEQKKLKETRFLITSRHTIRSDSAINPAKDD